MASHPMRFLRLGEVRKRVPYSKATIYRKIELNEFPRPYNLGARAVAWLESEIDAWIESRIEKQPQAEADRQASV